MHIDRNGIVCGHLIADGNSFCVKCGYPFDGKKRKVVREEEYDELKKKAKNTEVLFDGAYQKLWKCIDTNENEQFILKYRIYNEFRDSLMAVSNDHQWSKDARLGFVDRKGNLVINLFYTPYLFEDGSFYYPHFYKGRARVRYKGRNGYIDKTGKFTEEK